MSHALVIGEALIDITKDTDGVVREFPGGSPANVALGLARLGRQVELATWVGIDAHGQILLEHLQRDGVRVVPGSDAAARTSTALAELDADGAASYTFDLLWNVPEVHLDNDLAILHVGSIAATLQPGADAVAEIAQVAREHATVTYDVNARPTIMGEPAQVAPMVERLIARSDIVKVSDEDVGWLSPDTDPLDTIRGWATTGPSLVVLTRGGNGTSAVTSTGIELNLPAPEVEVADTVGAGDSYMSGLIDALWSADLLGASRRGPLAAIDEQSLHAAMTRAGAAAAITVSRPGANPPHKHELEQN
ncbi:MAG: carbohydrate kinase family protein [Beutenbergiaceae bacterium]